MTDRIRIPHAPKGIPDCGSFEVWFDDGSEALATQGPLLDSDDVEDLNEAPGIVNSNHSVM